MRSYSLPVAALPRHHQVQRPPLEHIIVQGRAGGKRDAGLVREVIAEIGVGAQESAEVEPAREAVAQQAHLRHRCAVGHVRGYAEERGVLAFRGHRHPRGQHSLALFGVEVAPAIAVRIEVPSSRQARLGQAQRRVRVRKKRVDPKRLEAERRNAFALLFGRLKPGLQSLEALARGPQFRAVRKAAREALPGRFRLGAVLQRERVIQLGGKGPGREAQALVLRLQAGDFGLERFEFAAAVPGSRRHRGRRVGIVGSGAAPHRRRGEKAQQEKFFGFNRKRGHHV